MKRRDFIRTGIGAGLLSGAFPLFGGLDSVYGQPANAEYDLAAVRGGTGPEMFDRAIEAIGGLGRFVKSGQKVVLKPNIGWDAPPERAANTNPELVGHIVQCCKDQGASEVYVFDNTCNKWDRCYTNSGIEAAVKKAGGKMVPGNTESMYREVEIPNGVKLKSAKVHKQILESDVFINVPIMKHHSSTQISLAMKNLMGVVWDRRFYHANDLNQCIADFCTFRMPDLNIIDGYNMMTKNGPRGVSLADVTNLKALIASTDIVAADAAATKMFGLEPQSIGHIEIAHKMKLGNMNLEELSISKQKIA
ncbi:DUF362 domain-containing protein [Carboxylicivirga caseinilyticus]|uniref:DUF362 domain-containing protein n=1 Tax=Carboxylicivirga caseinilyticus TaxID=3417572 RepID=UPI002AA8D479|nr:DUF362 domain-containing protein [uncultured Carboxylicivirga sp.]MCU4165328.1 DUF362 domain-containing protein [Marinilabiliaceae bacterium A049]